MTSQHEERARSDLHGLGSKARRGMALMVARTVAVQVVVLGGQVALARLLDPKDFGIFAIVQFVLSFFTFFGDAGLGGGLIQKKERPTDSELASVFWAQIGIAVLVVCVVFGASSFVRALWADLPVGTEWLLRALSIGLLLTTLRTIPAILMERELQFGRLGVLDVSLSVAFYVVATVLAWLELHVWALVVAVLVQGFVGLLLAYWFRPFRPRAEFSRDVLRPLLRFGVPYQLNRAIGFFNFAVTPIYAGAVLGARSVGLLNWAQNTGYFPLKLVEIVSRVTFPLYSRMQEERELLGESFGRALQLCAIVTAFLVALFWAMGANLAHVVYGDKWLPAIPMLHAYATAIAFGFLTPLAAPVLDATGRPQIVLKLSIFSTAASWLLVLFCTPRWGIMGFAVGYAVHVVLGNLILIVAIPKLIPHARLFRRIWAPIVAGTCVYLVARYALASVANDVVTLLGAVLALIVVHLGVHFVIDREGIGHALALVPTVSRGKPRGKQ